MPLGKRAAPVIMGAMAIEIRKARPADAPEVAEVFIASQAEALPFLSRLHTPEETRAFIANDVFEKCDVWVAVERGRIVGMMALAGTHLDHLYLLPGEYRRGIGSMLLNKTVSFASAKIRRASDARSSLIWSFVRMWSSTFSSAAPIDASVWASPTADW